MKAKRQRARIWPSLKTGGPHRFTFGAKRPDWPPRRRHGYNEVEIAHRRGKDNLIKLSGSLLTPRETP